MKFGDTSVEFLTKFFREKKPELRPRSIHTYVTAVRRVRRELGESFTEGEFDTWLSAMKPPQAKNYIYPVCLVLGKHVPALWKKYNRLAVEHLDKRELTARERENWTTVAALRRAVNRMHQDIQIHKVLRGARGQFASRQHYNLLRGWIAFSIHDQFQLRNDAASVRVLRTTQEISDHRANFYIKATGKFHFYVFKTMRAFQKRGDWPVVLEASKALRRKLALYLAKKPESPWLFCDLHGDPISRAQYNTILTGASKRYLGIRLGSTMLRHIYLSEFEAGAPTLQQRVKRMRRMLQTTVRTQLRYTRDEGATPPSV